MPCNSPIWYVSTCPVTAQCQTPLQALWQPNITRLYKAVKFLIFSECIARLSDIITTMFCFSSVSSCQKSWTLRHRIIPSSYSILLNTCRRHRLTVYEWTTIPAEVCGPNKHYEKRRTSLSLSLSIYIYIYIYIPSTRNTADCVSGNLSVVQPTCDDVRPYLWHRVSWSCTTFVPSFH
jgi:hypothetical protein